jgi:starch phosphorylase
MHIMKPKNPNPLLGKLSPSTNELLKSDKKSLQEDFVNHLEFYQAKDKYSATTRDFYRSLTYTVRDRLFERWIATQQNYYKKDVKRIYYISMEYMIGRTLGNALMNLDLTDTTREALWELGLDMEDLEEKEYDAGLGNGGLGRLAACFLDSMATMELPAYGYGIRYEYGIFSQKIRDGYQVEGPDPWLRYGNAWEIERPEYIYLIRFNGHLKEYNDNSGRKHFEWVDTDDVVALAYDTPIPGYKNNTVNNLRLWAAKSTREFNLDFFNSGDYEKAVEEKIASEIISKVLYPRDDFIQGRELRLKQEYFLTSATLQDIIRRFNKIYKHDFTLFPDKVAIQLNDTHPVLAIPELMRILIDDEGLPWKQAWNITTRTFGYTNHTVLPEALETWRVDLMQKVLPRHMQIINDINFRFLKEIDEKFHGDIARIRRMSIIEEGHEKKVRMASLAIMGCHSVNGVAQLHTEILKNDAFRDFYEIWPEKFNNKTNGITPRRWLKLANPKLSGLISEKIGDGWTTNLDLIKQILPLADDADFRKRWHEIKVANKRKLATCIAHKLGIEVIPDSMFDCQIKRIHEYKRQLLNILHVLTLYQRVLENPEIDMVPRTIIFSGKAAPAYQMAKLLIKMIHATEHLVNNNSVVGKKLKVVFIPDYSVSKAEIIIPAADLSEQISTAGMEASGTGNMKFALNGALTIGTLDGANVEMREEVGEENIFIFGLTSDQVRHYRSTGYNPYHYYENHEELRKVVDLITSGVLSPGEHDLFKPVTENLLHNDYFMVMADYMAYIKMQDEVDKVYRDQEKWTRMSIINSASMGKFSSDRTIKEYAEEIWKVVPVPTKLE